MPVAFLDVLREEVEKELSLGQGGDTPGGKLVGRFPFVLVSKVHA